MIEIAQNINCSFKKIISKIKLEDLFTNEDNTEKIDTLESNKKITVKIDESKFVRAGIRWQIFERDDFKCVACGKSAHEGAISHNRSVYASALKRIRLRKTTVRRGINANALYAVLSSHRNATKNRLI